MMIDGDNNEAFGRTQTALFLTFLLSLLAFTFYLLLCATKALVFDLRCIDRNG
jgi:hypothetical protein